MKKLLSIIIIASFTLLSGCEKSTDSFSSSLTGEWIWLKSCSGFDLISSTPESTGKNRKLVFTTDSICQQYENEVLKYSLTFHTYKYISQSGNDTIDILKFDGSNIQNSFSIRRDSLILIQYFVIDNSISYYKRKK